MAGGQATNDQAVQFEEQQAAQQQQQEAQRKQRLNQGMTAINQIFDGSPVMGTKNYDWSQFNGPNSQIPTGMTDPTTGQPIPNPTAGVPAGYTAVQVPAKSTSTAAGGAGQAAETWQDLGDRGWISSTGETAPAGSTVPQSGSTSAGTGANGNVWALQDANGKIYYPGDPTPVQYDTGQKTGGFDQNYYENYRQQYLNLYQPDEARQYQEAQRDLGYSLARSGLTRSSAAADKQGELAYNDQLQQAKIVSDASSAEQDLMNTVQSEKQSAINQLYSTEDPSLAASLAQNSASAINLKTPTFTPGAQLFGPALTTVATGIQAASSPYTTVSPYGAYLPGQAPGNVASAAASSGRAYS